jgi:hypothetical protein
MVYQTVKNKKIFRIVYKPVNFFLTVANVEKSYIESHMTDKSHPPLFGYNICNK